MPVLARSFSSPCGGWEARRSRRPRSLRVPGPIRSRRCSTGLTARIDSLESGHCPDTTRLALPAPSGNARADSLLAPLGAQTPIPDHLVRAGDGARERMEHPLVGFPVLPLVRDRDHLLGTDRGRAAGLLLPGRAGRGGIPVHPPAADAGGHQLDRRNARLRGRTLAVVPLRPADRAGDRLHVRGSAARRLRIAPGARTDAGGGGFVGAGAGSVAPAATPGAPASNPGGTAGGASPHAGAARSAGPARR